MAGGILVLAGILCNEWHGQHYGKTMWGCAMHLPAVQALGGTWVAGSTDLTRRQALEEP